MFHGLSMSCPCRTQLHHKELHDFSAKRARIQEAPEAQPPDLYLPCGFRGFFISFWSSTYHETHILACLGVISCPKYHLLRFWTPQPSVLVRNGMEVFFKPSSLSARKSSCWELSHTVHLKYLDLLSTLGHRTSEELSNTSKRI